VTVGANDLDGRGMVIDFHDLDRVLCEVIEPFEHRHLNAVATFAVINPSSENLARVVFDTVAEKLGGTRVSVLRCDVFENDFSMATYLAGDRPA
jgi:6-pyruvoyltetrahydropterin/6-carboxytetrahydropterin synthase